MEFPENPLLEEIVKVSHLMPSRSQQTESSERERDMMDMDIQTEAASTRKILEKK